MTGVEGINQSGTDDALTWARGVCLAMPSATTDSPFGPESEVYRLHRKVFALVLRNDRVSEYTLLNLKADPQEVSLLVDTHEFIIPGYHMSKKHWISVILSPDLNRALVEELIEDSYDFVSLGLPAGLRPLHRGHQGAGLVEPTT